MYKGNSEYFKNEWWDMTKIDHAREKQLNREHREVRDEMIFQEVQQGIKTQREIAEEYKVHKSTVSRINKIRSEK